jgi:putative membrane protein
MKLVIRWFIMVLALMAAAYVIPGIHVYGANGWMVYGAMALVLGFANAIIRPLLKFLSCGCIVATMGLFMLVVNALTLQIAAWIAQSFGVGFVIDGFWPAFWGAIVVSIVSFALNLFVSDEKKKND